MAFVTLDLTRPIYSCSPVRNVCSYRDVLRFSDRRTGRYARLTARFLRAFRGRRTAGSCKSFFVISCLPLNSSGCLLLQQLWFFLAGLHSVPMDRLFVASALLGVIPLGIYALLPVPLLSFLGTAISLPFLLFILVPFLFFTAAPGPSVALLHPQADSGGGGERVLWALVAHQLEKARKEETPSSTQDATSDAKAFAREPSIRDKRPTDGPEVRAGVCGVAGEQSECHFTPQANQGRQPGSQWPVAVYIRSDSPWLRDLVPVLLGPSQSQLRTVLLSVVSGLLAAVVGVPRLSPGIGFAVTPGSQVVKDLKATFAIDLDPLLQPPAASSCAPACQAGSGGPACTFAGTAFLSSSPSSRAVFSPLVLVPLRSAQLHHPANYPFCTLIFQALSSALVTAEALVLGFVPAHFVDTVGFPGGYFIIWILRLKQRCQRYLSAFFTTGARGGQRREGHQWSGRQTRARESNDAEAGSTWDRVEPEITQLSAYVHYPYVSGSMLAAVAARKGGKAGKGAPKRAPLVDAYGDALQEDERPGCQRVEQEEDSPVCNSQRIASSHVLSNLKLWYYRWLVDAYSAALRFAFQGNKACTGRSPCAEEQEGRGHQGNTAVSTEKLNVSCCNSTWTQRHLEMLMNSGACTRCTPGSAPWKLGDVVTPSSAGGDGTYFRAPVVFPPCRPSNSETVEDEANEVVSGRRKARILSIGQFRPEKRQIDQVWILREMLEKYAHLIPGDTHLVVAGSVENNVGESILKDLWRIVHEHSSAHARDGCSGPCGVGAASGVQEDVREARALAHLSGDLFGKTGRVTSESGSCRWSPLPGWCSSCLEQGEAGETSDSFRREKNSSAGNSLGCGSQKRDSSDSSELSGLFALKKGGALLLSSCGVCHVRDFEEAERAIDFHLRMTTGLGMNPSGALTADARRAERTAPSNAVPRSTTRSLECWGDRVFALVNVDAVILHKMAQSAAVRKANASSQIFKVLNLCQMS